MKIVDLTKVDIVRLRELIENYIPNEKILLIKDNGNVIFNNTPTFIISKLFKKGTDVDFISIVRELLVNLLENKRNNDAYAVITSQLSSLFDKFFETGNKSDVVRRLYLAHITEEAPKFAVKQKNQQIQQVDTSVYKVKEYNNGQVVVEQTPVAQKFVIANNNIAEQICALANSGSATVHIK